MAAALAPAIFAAAILVWFLAKKPPIYRRGTVIALLAGLGVLPIGTAAVGNLKGFQETKKVEFCAGCHVMEPWIADARNPEGENLASFHTRNLHLSETACYNCHADYSMYGAMLTKVQGSMHMWKYWTEGYRGMSTDEAIGKIRISKPFPNHNCMQCHSTKLAGWNDEPEHMAVAEDVRAGTTSCAAEGCHGPSHRVKTLAAEKAAEAGGAP